MNLSRLRGAARRDLAWRLRIEATLAARRLDPRPRADPDFVIVGAQKAGTSSLFAYLASHPDVTAPAVKEVHYFARHYHRGRSWYRRHFPLRSAGVVTGEATPFYLVYPQALERIAADLPQARVVTILRDPLARLVSQYRHSTRLGYETLSLADALAAEEERLAIDWAALAQDPGAPARHLQHHSYLHRSLYAPQVERVQRLFPDRSAFVRLEDLTAVESLRPLTEFLGLDFRPAVPLQTHNANPGESARARAAVPPAVVDRIVADAARTADLLGWDPWPLG